MDHSATYTRDMQSRHKYYETMIEHAALDNTGSIDPVISGSNRGMATKVFVSNGVNTINNDTFPPDVSTNNHNGDSIVLADESCENNHQVPLLDVNKSIIDDKFKWTLLVIVG